MHIADGVLRPEVAAMGTAAGIAAVSVATRYVSGKASGRAQIVANAGVAAAVLFAVSSVPLPAVAGTSAHPLGTPMIALVGGVPLAVLSTAVVVLLQALGGHGGISAWGADTLTMGLVAPLAAVAVYRGVSASGRLSPFWACTLATAAGCAATYLTTAALIANGVAGSATGFPVAFLTIVAGYLPAEAPMIVAESLATGFVAVRMMRSDIAARLGGLSPLAGRGEG